MFEKFTYFYCDEESLDPICALLIWLFKLSNHISVASIYVWVQKCLLFFFFLEIHYEV